MKITPIIKDKDAIEDARRLLALFTNRNFAPIIDLFLKHETHSGFTVEELKEEAFSDALISNNVISKACGELVKVRILNRPRRGRYTANKDKLQKIADGLKSILRKRNL